VKGLSLETFHIGRADSVHVLESNKEGGGTVSRPILPGV
jgi:hypothetical protein